MEMFDALIVGESDFLCCQLVGRLGVYQILRKSYCPAPVQPQSEGKIISMPP